MAGPIAARRVDREPEGPGRFVAEPAAPGDDAAIRALLSGQAMGGAIRLTLGREPSIELAAGIEGEPHHTVVIRERASGRVVACGSRAVRTVWLDGRPARLGYLAQLRRSPQVRLQPRTLAAGYAACEATRRPDELPFDLTAIVADNRAARRLLERGLPGLPVYRPWCELSTLTLPVGRGRCRRPPSVERASPELLPAIAACLERNLSRYQLAPVWTREDLSSAVRCRGLAAGDFLVAHEANGPVVACLALWDQRAFKQVVVRGYAPSLGRLRHLLNAFSRLAGGPNLPAPGSPLALAYLSHVAVDGDRGEVLVDLVRAARAEAARRGLAYLCLGLARENPMLPALRRAFRARELVSLLYLVERPEAAAAGAALGDRCPHVEVATL